MQEHFFCEIFCTIAIVGTLIVYDVISQPDLADVRHEPSVRSKEFEKRERLLKAQVAEARHEFELQLAKKELELRTQMNDFRNQECYLTAHLNYVRGENRTIMARVTDIWSEAREKMALLEEEMGFEGADRSKNGDGESEDVD